VVVNNYAVIISYLKKVIAGAGKKCYEVLVGKLNEPKLRNLQSIDVYVFVGCRETSLIDSKKFMMPVVTPHEALMAFKPTQFPWQCKIQTDF
jgi:diphthamide biosynthesis protein 2